jgi:prepilin-type N-terminal cleavage/methylation domain-containing protein
MPPARSKAFSLVEVLVCIAIVAVLLGILLPLLSQARRASHNVVCANNLRQIGHGWQGYIQDFQRFPQHTEAPDWYYGGVIFAGAGPFLDGARPINKYIGGDAGSDSREVAALFRCPADTGVFRRGTAPSQPKASVLDGGKNCFETFGTSYRANPTLLNSTIGRVDSMGRALKYHEVQVSLSRMLLLGDPAWFYATRGKDDPEAGLEASWHAKIDSGNMLAVDGSIRFLDFSKGSEGRFAIYPRPAAPE